MAIYSINDIEKLSGIKAHTIRIWEKRYGIITPKRTETNIRYYLDEDLRKILNISLLNKKGYKISRIAKMHEEEMKTLVRELSDIGLEEEDNIDALMFAMMELDEFKFNKILDHKIDSLGFSATMKDTVYPLMEKLSMMWIAGSIKGVHEDFVTNVIMRKTIVAIDNISLKYNPDAPRFLIYLPENETHELSLLYLHFILKEAGSNVINLGTNTALIDVIEGHTIFKANYIVTLFNSSFVEESLQDYINELEKYLTNADILISGYQTQAQNIKPPKNVTIFANIEEMKNLIKKFKIK